MSISCQIAVEGSPIKLLRDVDGAPDGPRGVLYALVPLVHNYFNRSDSYDAGRLMADLTEGMARSKQAFVLNRAEHKSSSTMEFIVETFQRKTMVRQTLTTALRQAAWYYIVRATEHIEVYEGNSYRDFPSDIGLVDLSRAERVVVPETSRIAPRAASN